MAEEEKAAEESGFVEGSEVQEGEALVGDKKAFVKKAGLAKAFSATAKEQLAEAREREVQLANMLAQQNKLIESMANRLSSLEGELSAKDRAMAAREQELLDKTGVKKLPSGALYAGGASVTPPSGFNIPSLEPVITPADNEGEATDFGGGYTGDIPFVVTNPHRMQVRVHDLKINPADKEDIGLLLRPFTTIDLREHFSEAQIKSSRGLRHCLEKNILVAAEEGTPVGQPSQEPDSLQKRLSAAIGKVPRRGKLQRNPKTGKIEKEQGIKDPALQAAAQAHVSQETIYDKELQDAREYEESGSNIV